MKIFQYLWYYADISGMVPDPPVPPDPPSVDPPPLPDLPPDKIEDP